MRRHLTALTATLATSAMVVGLLSSCPAAIASTADPSQDPFYRYSGSTSLAQVSPGTVLKTRSTLIHLLGIPLPVPTTQLLYRTTDTLGRPATTVTSVIKPPIVRFPTPRLVSFQIPYDSLTVKCEPSYAMSGNPNPADILNVDGLAEIALYLLAGYTVVTSDYEGQNLAFTAGRGSARQTLDGIRAAFRSPSVGLPRSTKVGLVGYSGGAIATEWAAELAPRYAPDVNRRLIGAAVGGPFVDPVHNLRYISGTPLWSAATPALLLGLSRGYDLDMNPYLSDLGQRALAYSQDKCLVQLVGHWLGLTYQQMFKPRYADITTIPFFVRLFNKLIMGTGGTPTVPMLIGVGTGGLAEGTPGNRPGIGAGDGVMIAGDVRTLARTYCRRGVVVKYHQYDGFSHIVAGPLIFGPRAQMWLGRRFEGRVAPSSCGAIAPGNSLAPLPLR